ncbi:SirB2 family protein [Paludibacterium paludis]|nr:SirB2 family protein [Paludibacterium paludis]
MTSYILIKHAHMSAAALSILLFTLRGVLLLRHDGVVLPRWLRIAPHINDTVLLGCAVAMLVILGVNPLDVSWIAAKIGLLILYIGLGTLAIKPRLPLLQRRLAFAAALLTVLFIVRIAVTRSPLPF